MPSDPRPPEDTYNLTPLLLCPRFGCGKAVEPPRVGSDIPAGPLECPECSGSMMLVEYAVLVDEARWHDLYRAVPMRGELRR